MPDSFMAAAIKAVTYSSPPISLWFGTAPYESHPYDSWDPLSLRPSAVGWISPSHSTLSERDDKMSKHAVADLGQRAQTLEPTVENGGRKRTESAVGEFIQWAVGSYKLSFGRYRYHPLQSP